MNVTNSAGGLPAIASSLSPFAREGGVGSDGDRPELPSTGGAAALTLSSAISDGEGYAKPGYAWAVVAILLAAYTVALLDRQIMSLMVEPIRRDLAITDTQLSTLMGFSFVLFYGTMGLALGRLADRLNRRNLIVGGIVIWCLATAACGFARSYWELFAARMMVGFGEAALSPAAYSMIADYFSPRTRPRANSVYSMGVFIGTGVAMIAGGAAIAAASASIGEAIPFLSGMAPWKLAFLLVGLPGLPMAAIMLAVREPGRKGRAKVAGSWHDLRVFLRGRYGIFLALLFGFGTNGLLNYCASTWGPSVFVRKFGWTTLQTGLATGLILLIAAPAGVLFGGWWATRRPLANPSLALLRTARTAMLCTVPLLVILATASAASVALAAMAVLMFAIGIPGSLAPAAFYEITPNEFRGQVTAFYLFAVSVLGLGIGVTAIAAVNDYVIVDATAIGTSMAIVMSVAAVGGALCLQAALRYHLGQRASP